ncbi:MAG: hypothetical protein JXQ87_11870 [Bacteroidia bacterium]
MSFLQSCLVSLCAIILRIKIEWKHLMFALLLAISIISFIKLTGLFTNYSTEYEVENTNDQAVINHNSSLEWFMLVGNHTSIK